MLQAEDSQRLTRMVIGDSKYHRPNRKILISCQHYRSSRNNPHYAPRRISYYYFSLMLLYYIFKVSTGTEMRNFVLSDT